ncbi:MAG: hypothetical protein LBB74_10345 [Chitinispirillales bacterium]|jgi:hypothetical protein|nr:hypothetical protein [Chitinispirillales bacterium]
MGVKTAKKAAVKKGKKAISGSKPKPTSGGKRISLGGGNAVIDAAILSMTASVEKASATAEKTSTALGVISADLSEKLAASEAMLSKKMVASEAMLSKKIAASEAMLSEKMALMSRRIGGLRQSVGEIVELVLLPGLMQKMNGLHHNYTISSPRKEFHRLDGSLLTEVDLLLENCDEVMAVEAKALFTMGDAERHLERLKKLRDNEAITGMRGKTIYAGAAGMQFAEGVIQKIRENGLYLITIDENNDRITVAEPEESVGRW